MKKCILIKFSMLKIMKKLQNRNGGKIMIETKNNYVENIKTLIENNIIETKKRNIQNENSKVFTYWNIGKQIVQAQKEDKIKYGNSFIKELSLELTKLYGKGYDYSNLRRMTNLYLYFPKLGTMCPTFITWSHLRSILPIKEENKRNYYINLVNDNMLSVRRLKEEIKNKAYERLNDEVKKKITLNENEKPTVTELIKDPLLINIDEEKMKDLDEKALKKVILEQIEHFLLELGTGFAFVGSEVKIKIGDKYRYIDLLFFNINEDRYFTFELKVNDLKPSDIGQLRCYMNYVDTNLKKPGHNPTIGVLICKKDDVNLHQYMALDNIKITTYKNKS